MEPFFFSAEAFDKPIVPNPQPQLEEKEYIRIYVSHQSLRQSGAKQSSTFYES